MFSMFEFGGKGFMGYANWFVIYLIECYGIIMVDKVNQVQHFNWKLVNCNSLETKTLITMLLIQFSAV